MSWRIQFSNKNTQKSFNSSITICSRLIVKKCSSRKWFACSRYTSAFCKSLFKKTSTFIFRLFSRKFIIT